MTEYFFFDRVFFFLADGLMERLRRDVKVSQRAAFATGTFKNLFVQWRTFISFCLFFNLDFLPTNVATLSVYAQLLSRSFKSMTSVRNYIHGVKVLHVIAGAEVEFFKAIDLKLVLRGLDRLNPHCLRKAYPISPDVLVAIFPFFDFSLPLHVACWSAFLFAFYMLARKSNMVPSSLKAFDCNKQLCRGDVVCSDLGLLITMKWSKTNQFGRKHVQIPLPRVRGSVLCPWSAYQKLVTLVPASLQDPLFVFGLHPRRCVTSHYFVKVLREMLGKAGFQASCYTGHSFRRGGASFAFKVGIPGELIKFQGDWSSEAYLQYLDFSLETRYQVGVNMRNWILAHKL